jgi:hypothetical protein
VASRLTVPALNLSFPVRVVVYPAPDLAGVWISHALDLDVMAQGASRDDAVETLMASLTEMIAYRLNHGMTAVEWDPAPEEIWAAAEAVSGERLDRAPPEIRFFASPGDSEPTTPGPRVFVTDHAPLAHAC